MNYMLLCWVSLTQALNNHWNPRFDPINSQSILFLLIGNQEIVSETCDMVARKLVPKCVHIDDTFSEYNDEDDEDILDLRTAEDDFNIPVCE